MSLSLNSGSVLRAIADNPEAFAAVKSDVDEFARKILVKQIKHRSTDLAVARSLCRSAGTDALATVLDGFAPNEITAFLKKIDAHNAAVKDNDTRAVRAAVDELLASQAEPTAKPVKPAKASSRKEPQKTPAKPKIGDLLESKVHAGTPRKSKTAKKA